MNILKDNLKTQAKELRELKSTIRYGMQTNKPNVWEYQLKLLHKKEQFRYEHIAYCILRGRRYEDIERNTKPNNTISMSKVEGIVTAMKADLYIRFKNQEAYNV